ncbi:MAG: transcriptional regulator [Thermoplasmata archaeon]|nr:transcriptional regulator [Thermoplasmata archaeon]
MKADMVQTVREMLLKAGFEVSRPHHLKAVSFDLVAKRRAQVLFLKILTNVDTFSEENARALMLLSSILGGSPLRVGERNGGGKMEDGVVYKRFGIPVVTPGTLYDYMIEGVPPLAFAAPGGLYVNIDGRALRRIRMERHISLGEIAEAAGVSRRTIQLYEDGQRGAVVDVALRIEDYLDVPLIEPIEILSPFQERDSGRRGERPLPGTPLTPDMGQIDISPLEAMWREVFNRLREEGCNVTPVAQAPFERVVEKRVEMLLTGVGRYNRTLVKKAVTIGDVSRVVEKESVVIVDERKRREEIEGTPLISIEEILCLDHVDQFLELIKERSRDKREEQ